VIFVLVLFVFILVVPVLAFMIVIIIVIFVVLTGSKRAGMSTVRVAAESHHLPGSGGDPTAPSLISAQKCMSIND